MSKLQKLDDVLKELEAEVDNLQEIHRVYTKIESLSEDYQKVIEEIQNNYELLENLLEKHENFQGQVLEKIENSVEGSTESLGKVIAEEVHNGIERILQANLTFQNVLNVYLENFKELEIEFKVLSENFEKNSLEFQSKHLVHQKEIIDTLQNYIQTQQEQFLNIQSFLVNFHDEQKSFESKLLSNQEEQLKLFKKNHEEFLAKFEKSFESLSEYIKAFKTDLENLILELLLGIRESQENFQTSIRKEQKEYYRDLEDLVRIKLDENKSETKLFVEQLISSLKESLVYKVEKKIDEIKEKIIVTQRNNMIVAVIIILFGLVGLMMLLKRIGYGV